MEVHDDDAVGALFTLVIMDLMHSPATGKILSDLILTGHSDLIETEALGFDRFNEGRAIEETAVL